MNPPLSRWPVTVALMVACVVVFLLMEWNREAVIGQLLISQYYHPVLPEIDAGEVWRLVTPSFLHFGIFHLGFNLLWTWEFGRLIESRQGSFLLAGIFVTSSLAANIAQFLVDGPAFGGMSGVIYTFFGYTWIQGLINPRFGARLNPSIVYLLLGWFIVCWTGILEPLFGLTVANTGHTAGLASGVALSFVVAAGQGAFHRRPRQ